MTQHTPGPWTIHGMNITGSDDKREEFASGVCTVDNDDDRQGAGVAQANARLISAAPELLEALRGLLAYVDELNEMDLDCPCCCEPWTAHSPACEVASARAAIRRATGEEA